MSTTKTKTEVADAKSGFADKISIRPFFEEGKENMGLEKHGMVLFPNCIQEEQLTCIDQNGIVRYVTGLDEFAPEIKNITDPSEKKARISYIRKQVIELEKELASNIIKEDDPEFWNKVTLLKPNNVDFWGKVIARGGNDPIWLNPSNPHDRLKIIAIEAGGFAMIAKSKEDAKSRPVPTKFYLDKITETASYVVGEIRTKNKAIAILQELYDSNPEKMFLVVKLLDPSSAHYKKNTPNDIMYEVLDRYINGKFTEKVIKKASETFMQTCDIEIGDLKLRAIMKDAIFYRLLTTRPGGQINLTNTSTMLGRNLHEVMLFLKDPTNQDITVDIMKKVEQYWFE